MPIIDRHAGISQPYKLSRVYERDPKTKKTKMMQMMRIKDISAGSNHGAMVDELGKVFSWGAGTYGRTGLGDPMDTHTPVWMQSLDHPRYILHTHTYWKFLLTISYLKNL